jgi:Fe-S-cluster containining protein
MDIKSRCDRLKSIYAIYDEFVAGTQKACRKHCALCCTCNVTGTTLEGWLIHDHFRSGGADPAVILEALPLLAASRRFQPRMTINGMAALCMQGRELPDELNDPAAGRCPLIKGDICPIYEVRPFGCRAMLSTAACHIEAEACMPPLILSVNNIVMQFIEALDQPGASGNLIDLLLFFSDPAQRRAYECRQDPPWPQTLVPNQSIPVLMIPPEHRKVVQPLLRSLSMCSR